MESFAVFPEGEFDSLNRMFSIDELDFTQQLHMFSFPLENNEGFNFINPSNFCPNPEPNAANGFNESNHHIIDWFPSTFPSIAMEDSTLVTLIERDQIDHNNSSSYQNTKKRPRVLKLRAPSPKKHCKINIVNGNGGDSNIGSDSLSCSRTSSLEDDKNVSQDTNNRKTRASTRGLATDPQSLYARKRRERINERLRILQSLVPNGTKVDISTMLEEAVQYVKFLQLQIKLLSSDDLWMYAPIAYNGIGIGLDKNISKLLDMNLGKEASLIRSS